jgi:tetratricopeptide (TPR) repeat protein
LASALRYELTFVRRSRRWIGNHRILVLGLGAVSFSAILAVVLFLALRSPYDARQLQLGLAHYEHGAYALAVDCLNDAVRANPASSETLFARGRAYQRLGRFDIAFRDYGMAYRLERSGVLKACEGYCLSRLQCYRDAITAYQRALETGYDSPAILHNNIGYTYLLLGQVGDAEEHLEQAIRLDDTLQAAHCNMVGVFLRRAFRDSPIPEAAFAHATKAIEIGPRTAELYYIIAALYAVAAKGNDALVQPAIDYVAKAVESGYDPKEFTSTSAYFAIRQEPAFRDALQKPVSVRLPPKATLLVDPLDKLH